MAKKRGAPSRRESILNAASNVVNEHGAAQLTLDATAAAAGVSKGGLLYHFPSKDQLIEALLDAYLDGFDARIEALLKSNGDSERAGQYLRAYVQASFEDPLPDAPYSAAALAIVTAHPELKVKIAKRYEHWQARVLQDGLPADRALAIMLATDGVWATELLGLRALDGDRRSSIRDYLFTLIDHA
ncbi:MAG: hypothetical protein B6D42_00310 [Anaerolineae bacterium UTCFX5]|jgi:AcrR family transcriptional regulator|nr:MAG: hypothetical protein B6D42_00310 [Anaerolineae bacterium UTCFX5]